MARPYLALGAAFLGITGAALAAFDGGWVAFATVESPTVSKCMWKTCPNGQTLIPRGSGECDLPFRCCAHYNCNTMQVTETVCCIPGISQCKFENDPVLGPRSVCDFTE
jgi:hypothetical protein